MRINTDQRGQHVWFICRNVVKNAILGLAKVYKGGYCLVAYDVVFQIFEEFFVIKSTQFYQFHRK